MKRRTNKPIFLYPVSIEPCEEGGYFAACPALQGCHAEGETYGEAIDNIHEAIKAHLAAREEYEQFKPKKIKRQFRLDIQIPVAAAS
jgi:predicted RNase H-like HicB family nuclease